jgi:hypothetical protein
MADGEVKGKEILHRLNFRKGGPAQAPRMQVRQCFRVPFWLHVNFAHPPRRCFGYLQCKLVCRMSKCWVYKPHPTFCRFSVEDKAKRPWFGLGGDKVDRPIRKKVWFYSKIPLRWSPRRIKEVSVLGICVGVRAASHSGQQAVFLQNFPRCLFTEGHTRPSVKRTLFAHTYPASMQRSRAKGRGRRLVALGSKTLYDNELDHLSATALFRQPAVDLVFKEVNGQL